MAVCRSTQRIFQSLEPWEVPGNPSWWAGGLEPSTSWGPTVPVCPALLAGPWIPEFQGPSWGQEVSPAHSVFDLWEGLCSLEFSPPPAEPHRTALLDL